MAKPGYCPECNFVFDDHGWHHTNPICPPQDKTVISWLVVEGNPLEAWLPAGEFTLDPKANFGRCNRCETTFQIGVTAQDYTCPKCGYPLDQL